MVAGMSRLTLTQPPKRRKHIAPVTLTFAVKSYVGHLEGTGKSANSISSYRSDLKTFSDYINIKLNRDPVVMGSLTIRDIENYQSYLKASGLGANTRRRKTLCLRRFFRYLNKRGYIHLDIETKLPAPHKVEKIPEIIDLRELKSVLDLDVQTDYLDLRNKVLIWTMAETGALVSEVVLLRFADLRKKSDQFELRLGGSETRTVQISPALGKAFEKLKHASKPLRIKTSWAFLGFNRSGPLGSHMSKRAAELILKSTSLNTEFKNLTPRLLRHSCAAEWLKSGIEPCEVQRRLGLKTQYSFKMYQKFMPR